MHGMDSSVRECAEKIGKLNGYQNYTMFVLKEVKMMVDDHDKAIADKIISLLNERELFVIEQMLKK